MDNVDAKTSFNPEESWIKSSVLAEREKKFGKTCGTCDYNNGICYTSNPPQRMCIIDCKLHRYDEPCAIKLKMQEDTAEAEEQAPKAPELKEKLRPCLVFKRTKGGERAYFHGVYQCSSPPDSCGNQKVGPAAVVEYGDGRMGVVRVDAIRFTDREQMDERYIEKKVTHMATKPKDCTCPNCLNVVDEFYMAEGRKHRVMNSHCKFCGQALDWSEYWDKPCED